MKLTYTQRGDYLLPDLTLTNEPVPTYGKYGRMRKRYLQEHRKTLYNNLLLSDKLVAHLNDVDRAGQRLSCPFRAGDGKAARRYRNTQGGGSNGVGQRDEHDPCAN